MKVMVIAILLCSLFSIPVFLWLWLVPKKQGFLDPMVGFLLRMSTLMARGKPEIPWEHIQQRREKTKADLRSVTRPRSKARHVDLSLETGTAIRIHGLHDGSSMVTRDVVLYFHGGGYVVGDLDYGYRLCQDLADLAHVIVISVDYPLAPEHPWPKAFEAGRSVLGWLQGPQAMNILGGSPGRVFVMGDSAGGHLAGVLALQVQGEGFPPIAGQILLYPVIDFGLGMTKSYQNFDAGFMLSRADMEWFRSQAFPNPDTWKTFPVNLALAGTEKQAPRTLLVCAEFDVLCDEAMDYGRQLQGLGVEVEVHLARGMTHGFAMMDAFLPQARALPGLVGRFLAKP